MSYVSHSVLRLVPILNVCDNHIRFSDPWEPEPGMPEQTVTYGSSSRRGMPGIPGPTCSQSAIAGLIAKERRRCTPSSLRLSKERLLALQARSIAFFLLAIDQKRYCEMNSVHSQSRERDSGSFSNQSAFETDLALAEAKRWIEVSSEMTRNRATNDYFCSFPFRRPNARK